MYEILYPPVASAPNSGSTLWKFRNNKAESENFVMFKAMQLQYTTLTNEWIFAC